MEHVFSRIPTADIPRSSFNRSHGHKTTFDGGYLVPFYVDEALPGDTFAVKASVFARLATPIVPFMDNLTMDVFFFFVPNRLVWDNWQKFMGEQVNPGDSTDFTIPQVGADTGGFPVGSLADYFGLPTGVENIIVSALPFRAYNLIYNEWFRDQNIQDSLPVPKTDGPDLISSYVLKKRGKRHDYFTSCLPWPQKGPGVELPIGTTAPIYGAEGKNPTYQVGFTGDVSSLSVGAQGAPGVLPVEFSTNVLGGGGLTWSDPALYADLSQATSVTINKLREAFQIQRLLERDARGGTRYTEILRSHFGVVSPDSRLQRPEYLGGGSVPVSINPVVQNSATGVNGTTPQGNLAAYGVAGGRGIGFHKSFVEHGIVIGIVMVRADLNYQQGVNRSWLRKTRYDFYWPAFAHLGEQVVYNAEIYAQGNETADKGAFGYQERWAEYRYYPSQITGMFRSQAPDSLDIWHLAQRFTTLPTLQSSFIEDSTESVVNRVIAVQSEPQFLFDSHIAINAVRPMPTYSVPGLIDHF